MSAPASHTDQRLSTGGPEGSDVIVERRGRLGLVTLSRPKTINALTHGMVAAISAALDEWEVDPAIATVTVTGAGDRGLCAGGDVVSLYHDAMDGDGSSSAAFWRDEYAMNARIARYPKPFVAIQDGLVLGGGVGLSAHGSHRVVTERSVVGFPEVTIGFVPDVGATWLLSHAPDHFGTRLALTGESVGAADAILVGLSDVFVPRDKVDTLLAALETQDAPLAVASAAEDPGTGILHEERDWTRDAFAAESIPAIIDALRRSEPRRARELADLISSKSPLALAVAREALSRAARMSSLEAALDQEYRVSRHAFTTHDFTEGIRAQLIEKDRTPRWQPREHADVEPRSIAAFFDRPPGGDLGLSGALSSKEKE
ncbi:enoyl-CoA hydratase/isomerase family protein [Microbacterium sp. zg.B48]|uniref:enoyl-CoA hydratase/isomerase family protein n=1 Tax=Microbacterium sp. zg.B48 TaxID=2969408 RepID=UPI00214B230B|nr:enoyl-CoA hydratase/isomerase family protein [Microbacterium sp. zg.B48]MCR2764372.1 enoyl-CoA hydratase/isomerase family protein [Microbacterium sp. zg.B48]